MNNKQNWLEFFQKGMTEYFHPVEPDDNWQVELDYVRAAYPLRQRLIEGHGWEYILGGHGPEAVLILPGGLASAETAFHYILRLEPHYRVLAPTYPETIGTMAGLVDGLWKLLRAEQLSQVHVIGGSYSGLVAQCLVRHRPELVVKLVLADTGVPRPIRARQYSLGLLLARYLPVSVVRGLLRLSVALFLMKLSRNREFWWGYFSRRLRTMNRAAWVHHLAIWREFDRDYRFRPDDLADWAGQALILEAEHDGLFGHSERLALRKLYPFARIHTFEKSSHCASLAQMDDYIRVIGQFLAGREVSA